MSIFQLIRLVLSAVLALGVFCLARKKLKSKKILWAAAAAAWIIFDIALCETPFENLFYTFRTPEDAGRYVDMDRIVLIVNGQESGMLFSESQNEFTGRIFPKTEQGWKMSGESATHIRGTYIGENATVQLWQYAKTSEYYVVAICFEPESTVQDTLMSDFLQIPSETNEEGLGEAYAAYVPAYAQGQYAVFVNGEQILLS